jgi:hypothetical protein
MIQKSKTWVLAVLSVTGALIATPRHAWAQG